MAEKPIHLTYDAAKTLLRQAVLEKGADHVFAPIDPDTADSYYYFDPKTGVPGCIVGHVMSYKGITKDQLGNRNTATGFGTILRIRRDVITCDRAAKALLVTAQEEQDAGDTWSNAVEAAVVHVENCSEELGLVPA